MKKYNIPNYIRYKNELKSNYPEHKQFYEYSRDDLVVQFLPLVENPSSTGGGSMVSGVLQLRNPPLSEIGE